jgi:hypothetical protein
MPLALGLGALCRYSLTCLATKAHSRMELGSLREDDRDHDMTHRKFYSDSIITADLHGVFS